MSKFLRATIIIILLMLAFSTSASTPRLISGFETGAKILAAQMNQEDKCKIESMHPGCDDKNAYNGYWWPVGAEVKEGWVPALPSLETWFTHYPDFMTGASAFYAPNAMENTARVRGLQMAMYGKIGAVATNNCADIGQSVWLRRPIYDPKTLKRGGLPVALPNQWEDWEGPFLVVDCARRSDMYGVTMFRHEAVEVDYETAHRWGMVDYAPNAWGKDRKTFRLQVKFWRFDGMLISKIPPELLTGDEIPIKVEEWLLTNYMPGRLGDVNWQILYEAPTGWKEMPHWRIGGDWVQFEKFVLPTSTLAVGTTTPEAIPTPEPLATLTVIATAELLPESSNVDAIHGAAISAAVFLLLVLGWTLVKIGRNRGWWKVFYKWLKRAVGRDKGKSKKGR